MVDYVKWNKADRKVKCYILASMWEGLQDLYWPMNYARELIMYISELFAKNDGHVKMMEKLVGDTTSDVAETISSFEQWGEKMKSQLEHGSTAKRGKSTQKGNKGRCYKCNQLGHMKWDCPSLNKVNEQGKSYSLIIETCLAHSSSSLGW